MQWISKLPFFKRNGSNIVVIKPITFGAFSSLAHMKQDELTEEQKFTQYKEAIFACTDITADEFARFTAPDFNQLGRDINAVILQPSDLLRGKPLDGETFSFDLLFPFTNELGDEIKRVTFDIPTVGHSEALARLTDDKEREAFMFQAITGLDKRDIRLMALNDYLSIKLQVGNFFIRSAEFFEPKM